MTWFLFFLLALGVARVTWFISEDHLPLIANPREWIVSRDPDSNLAYLVNCWWCVSVYVGAVASAFATWVLNARITMWFVHIPGLPQDLARWKEFLLLWPALSFTGVTLMSIVDTLQAHGSED